MRALTALTALPTLPKFGALTVLAALWGTTGALAQPSAVRLSFVGDPSHTVAVTWNTATKTPTSTVQWGFVASVLQLSVEGTRFVARPPLGWIHEATIDGLPPDTTVYYRVGDAADGWSAVQSFTTAAPADFSRGEFRFVVTADGRSHDDTGAAEIWPAIALEAASEAPSFMLYGGDQVRDGNDSAQWLNWLHATEPILGWFAHMPTIGNHDDGPGQGEGANYNQVFQLPRADSAKGGSGTEDFYYFTYENAIFVGLSTWTFTDGKPAFAQQAAWLDAVLAEHPRLWKVVYFHHPVYTGRLLGVNHPPDEMDQNQALVPVFDKHHVDVVFGSHNHWYERFAPSACGDGSEQPCPTGDFSTGTVYITTGGAGAFTYDFPGACRLSNEVGREACDGRHHYVLVDIADNRLGMQVWATRAQILSTADENRRLIDSLTIVKPIGTTVKSDDWAAEYGQAADSVPRSLLSDPGDVELAGGCGCALGARPID